ncbi:MAG: bifunctional DedA family/phosphatase PAP2 family protein [Actinobacteria bacterium]|nr:bifunctional DedA family/phosphatase PAP2 family protein [Actinomycetota bacterium]
MDFLLGLAEPWAYLLIGSIAAAESALFAGLVLPGEATVLLGGVLVFQGRASLGVMLAAACLGAATGDQIGYGIGRRYGTRIMAGRFGRRVGAERWRRAQDYLRRRGGRAVLIARYIGVLRALMPAIAGSARLPYRTFAAYSIVGAVTWAGGFTLLGVAAGGSYSVVEAYAGRATLILAGVLAVALALAFGARYVQNHLADFGRRRDDFLERPLVARLRDRLRPQIDFVERRLDPTQRFGLYLTIGVALSVAGAWLFGGLLEDVAGNEELSLIDRPVLRWVVLHREPALDAVMKVLTGLGAGLVVSLVMSAAALVTLWSTRQSRWAVFFMTTLYGVTLLDDAVKGLVGRPRPRFHPLVQALGSSFPSGHAAAAAGMCAALAYVATRHLSPRRSVPVWTVAVGVSLLVGFTRIYLGVHWPTDVLGGLALGGFWTAVTATATTVIPMRSGGSPGGLGVKRASLRPRLRAQK